MNPRKLTERLQQQSAVARKVYEALPMAADKALRVGQVVGAMKQAGVQLSTSTAEGILEDLRSDGLLVMRDGAYSRVLFVDHPKESPVKAVPAPAQAAQDRRDPFGALAEVAARLRTLAAEFGQLAVVMESAAIAAEEQRAAADEDGKRLRQLRALLREV